MCVCVGGGGGGGGGGVTEHNSDRGVRSIVTNLGKTQVGKTELWKLITLEKFNSRNDCFCKSALWETTSLEHSWPLSATVYNTADTFVIIKCTV